MRPRDVQGCEGERAVVEGGEFEVRSAREDGFGDVGLGHADAQVVIDSPKTSVEEVMGFRGSDSIVRPKPVVMA